MFQGQKRTSRRQFLSQSAALTAAVSWSSSRALAMGGPFAPLRAADSGVIPILQTATNRDSTQIRVVAEGGENWNYRVLTAQGVALSQSQVTRQSVHPHSTASVDHLSVTGLSVGEVYRLEVIDASGALADWREFRSLDIDSPRAAKFALISCMNDEYSDQVGMWREVANSGCDVIFFIGDAVYADKNSDGSIEGISRRFLETKSRLDVYFWRRLVPVVSTWDDHDFGLNNADRRFPLKDDTKRIFLSHYGSNELSGYRRGPGVSGCYEAFGQRFLLMDNRYFRDPPQTAGTHWGNQQEEWMIEILRENDRPVWLLSGSQYFGAYLGVESYEGDYRDSFRAMLKELKRHRCPVIFGSGDVHFSEIMEIEKSILGYKTYELTSSSLHSATFPGQQYRLNNPRRLTSTYQHNFLAVSSQFGAGKVEFGVESIGYGGASIFSRRLSL